MEPESSLPYSQAPALVSLALLKLSCRTFTCCSTSYFVNFENTSRQMPFILLSEHFKAVHIVYTTVTVTGDNINPLNTKRRLLYLKTQFVPRRKHSSARL